MTVRIKDVMLKPLPEGGFVTFDKAALPAGTVPLEKPKPIGKQQQKAKKQPKAKAPAKKIETPANASTSAVPTDGFRQSPNQTVN